MGGWVLSPYLMPVAREVEDGLAEGFGRDGAGVHAHAAHLGTFVNHGDLLLGRWVGGLGGLSGSVGWGEEMEEMEEEGRTLCPRFTLSMAHFWAAGPEPITIKS